MWVPLADTYTALLSVRHPALAGSFRIVRFLLTVMDAAAQAQANGERATTPPPYHPTTPPPHHPATLPPCHPTALAHHNRVCTARLLMAVTPAAPVPAQPIHAHSWFTQDASS